MQLDPEEIFGVATVDVGRRVLVFFGCHLVASFFAALSLGVGTAVVDLSPSAVFDWLTYLWLIFLLPCVSVWGVIYIPTIIASAFRFFTSQGALLRQFLGFFGVEGLLIVLAMSQVNWACLVSVVLFAGFWGSTVWLGLQFEQRLRRKADEHFMGLAVENEGRRRELREGFGTESFDGVDDGS